MPNVSASSLATRAPEVYDYTHCGSAAGTTIILNQPGVIGGIYINRRAPSASIIVYDSVGTSGTVIGTIATGTQTAAFLESNAQPWYAGIRTRNGLTVAYPADVDLTVAAA